MFKTIYDIFTEHHSYGMITNTYSITPQNINNFILWGKSNMYCMLTQNGLMQIRYSKDKIVKQYNVSCTLKLDADIDSKVGLHIDGLFNSMKNRSVTYEAIGHFVNIANPGENLLCDDREEILFVQTHICTGENPEIVSIFDAVTQNTPSSFLSTVQVEALAKNIYLHDQENMGLKAYNSIPIYL